MNFVEFYHVIWGPPTHLVGELADSPQGFYCWPFCFMGKMVVPLGWVPLNDQPHAHLISSGYLLGPTPTGGLSR